jgi:hypothetical protein
MMKNALIEELILIEKGCAASESATKDGESASLTFSRIECTIKDLVITKTKIGRIRPANDNRVRLFNRHTLSQHVIDCLRLPRRDRSEIEEADRVHLNHQ